MWRWLWCVGLGMALAALPAGEALPPLIADAEALLIVRDGRWLQEWIAAIAAASGRDPRDVQEMLASWLFRCRSFEGIDTTRPVVVAWRQGPAPFTAIVPLNDRQRFVQQFGLPPENEPPLVRTGEREGTTIYRQNQGGQEEWEYRLLVARHTAFIARTVEECHALAASGLAMTGSAAPPLELRVRHLAAWERVLPVHRWRWPFLSLPTGGFAALGDLWRATATGLAQQVHLYTLTCESPTRGTVRVRLQIQARPDSALAHWIAGQRPSNERLAEQMSSGDTALLAVARLVFQGQLERWLVTQGTAVQTIAGAGWNDTSEDAYRTLGLLIERMGALALAVETVRPTTKAPPERELETVDTPPVWRCLVVEHPRAAEFAHAWALVVAALERQPLTSDTRDGRTFHQVGKHTLGVGTRHVVYVESGASRGDSQAVKHIAAVLARLERQAGSIENEPVVLDVRADLAQFLKTPPRAQRPVPVRLRLQVPRADQLLLQTDLPVLDVVRAMLGEAGDRDE